VIIILKSKYESWPNVLNINKREYYSKRHYIITGRWVYIESYQSIWDWWKILKINLTNFLVQFNHYIAVACLQNQPSWYHPHTIIKEKKIISFDISYLGEVLFVNCIHASWSYWPNVCYCVYITIIWIIVFGRVNIIFTSDFNSFNF